MWFAEVGRKRIFGRFVEQATPPYSAEMLIIDGHTGSLPPKAVIPVTLALHELAPNAAKYGALSAPTGRVSIAWQYDRKTSPFLGKTLQERGGPEVVPPTRKG